MFNINTKNISYNTKDIDGYIKKYVENSNDFYNELSKLSSYWKGYDFDSFNRKILKQMENDLIISEGLNKLNSVYKRIEYIYEEGCK